MIDIKKTNEFFNSYHQEMGTNYITKPPNAVMNDYTKNISQSIFTPGVHQIPKSKRLERIFSKSHYKGQVPGKLYTEKLQGDDIIVKGKLGEKIQVSTKERFNKNKLVSQSTNDFRSNFNRTLNIGIPKNYETTSSAVVTVKSKFDKLKAKNEIRLKEQAKYKGVRHFR